MSMNSKQKSLLAVLAAAGCVLLYGLSRQLTISRIAHAQVATVAFTVEQWSFGSDGKLTESRTTARRSDGSEAVISHHPETAPARQILNPDGSTATFFNDFKAKWSYYKTSQERAHRAQLIQHPPVDCVEMPGAEKVLVSDPDLLYGISGLVPDDLGTKAIPVIRETGTWRHVEMRAPSLGCFPLAVIHEVKSKQDWTPLLEVKAIYLKIAEPDPILFARSDEYKEMKPSELRKEALRKQGVTAEQCPTCFKSNWDVQADAAYAARQKP